MSVEEWSLTAMLLGAVMMIGSLMLKIIILFWK